MNVKQYSDDAGVNHIDIEQTSTGNVKNLEDRTLDGQWTEKKDGVFGNVKRQTRVVPVAEVEDSYLADGWDQKSLEQDNGEIIHSIAESVGLSGDQWTANQAWGFEVIDGHRRCVLVAPFAALSAANTITSDTYATSQSSEAAGLRRSEPCTTG